MKTALALAILLVAALASPAAADDARTNPGALEGSAAAAVMRSFGREPGSTLELEAVQTHDTGEPGAPATSASDDGADGTDFATFAALAIGGMALVAALAALVMGRQRIPS